MLSVTLLLALAPPQLHVEPYRGEVGIETAVHVAKDGAACGGLEIIVELPDGTDRAVGRTDANGDLRFVPDLAGSHVVRAEVDGLRMLAPFHVVTARPRWLTAAVCVPLGLALLWRNLSRARARRAH